MKYAKFIRISLSDFLLVFFSAVAIALAMWGSVYMSGHIPTRRKEVVISPTLNRPIPGMKASAITSMLSSRGYSIDKDTSAGKITCELGRYTVEIFGLNDVVQVSMSIPVDDSQGERVNPPQDKDFMAEVASIYYDGADRGANSAWAAEHIYKQDERDDGIVLIETRVSPDMSALLIRPSRSQSVQP